MQGRAIQLLDLLSLLSLVFGLAEPRVFRPLRKVCLAVWVLRYLYLFVPE